MTKRYVLESGSRKEGREESYLAPPPPKEGRVIGVDCHPDSFTAAVFKGQTPHEARKLGSLEKLSMEELLRWAVRELSARDIILMEAGANSFELCKRLGEEGLRACVLESCHVGRHAKTYADNDRMAAARIALVYLAGNAPCVWVPDEKSLQRRELLHAYRKAVRGHTATSNAIKGYLNTRGIRLGKRSLSKKSTQEWILGQRDWSALQKQLLQEYFQEMEASQERRKRLSQLIAQEMAGDAAMMRCMKVLGVGMVSAFGLLAVIGEINRFQSPEKLVAYVGLNPGQRQSGSSKNKRLGVGKRGRGDLRALLIQGAQAVLRTGRHTPLGQWGWKLFARKGCRNVAVAALARKLLVQVWHVLRGNTPALLEPDKSLRLKLQKLAVTLGAPLRKQIGLGLSLRDCVHALLQRCMAAQQPLPS